MSRLAWKELWEWGPPCAALLLALCVCWGFGGSVAQVLQAPRQEPTLVVLATASLCGILLGGAQLGLERSRGALPYLAHREGGKRALLRAKLAVGAPLALALGALPPIWFLVQQSFGPFGAVLLPARAFEHALAGLVALPAYACGLLVVLIAPSGFLRFALGLLSAMGCVLWSLWLPLPVQAMSSWSAPLFALGELALAGGVLALARRLFLRSHDRDAVLPFRLQAGAAGLALLLVVLPAWWAFSSSVRSSRVELFNGYPLVVRYADGRYAEMERAEFQELVRVGTPGQTTFTLPDGTVVTEPDPALVYNPAPPLEIPKDLRRTLTLGDLERWSPIGAWGKVSIESCYLDRGQGVVHEFLGGDAKLASPTHTVLRRPDGKPFSRETLVLGDGSDRNLLVDRGDRTLWKLHLEGSHAWLAPLSLPDDDVLVDAAAKEVWEPEGWSASDDWNPVLVGQRGRYQWTASGFQPEGSPAAKPWWLRYCRSETGEASLAAATVRLRAIGAGGSVGPESEILFVQRCEPRTPREIGRVGLMRAGMLCGPPVLSLQRLLADSNVPLLRGILPSPAAMPRDSTWFHLVHALLGVALGYLGWRHVARRGGSLAERLLWGVLGALFGVFALCFLRMLAPRPETSDAEQPARASAGGPVSPLAAI